MSTIEIKNVSKTFGKTVALKDVSISLLPNKIYGLLGRNGAGKTTLINIITNKLFASTGDVLIDGETVVENDNALAKIYCMTEKNIHPEEMKVKDGFKWSKEFYPSFDTDYAYDLSEKFQLNTNKKIKELSTGYNSIFKLILTLSVGTPLIIFDEPVLGLDANHRELFYKELIKNYSEHPKTIVISTHLIEEISNVLEEVIIIKDGQTVISQSLDNVLELAYSVSGECINVDNYLKGKNVLSEETIGKFKVATIYQKRDKADKDLIQELGLEITPAKLQELFISLTNS